MRALRSSLYMDAEKTPVTTVVLESDVRDTLESVCHQLLEPGLLVIHDIFESADDIVTASTEGMKRQADNALQENHQAMLYFWTVQSWSALTDGGMLFMDKPTPMSREEIQVVFAQLAQHPEYRHFTIVSHTHAGERVEMIDGVVKPRKTL